MEMGITWEADQYVLVGLGATNWSIETKAVYSSTAMYTSRTDLMILANRRRIWISCPHFKFQNHRVVGILTYWLSPMSRNFRGRAAAHPQLAATGAAWLPPFLICTEV